MERNPRDAVSNEMSGRLESNHRKSKNRRLCEHRIVVKWKVVYTKRAVADIEKLKECGLGEKARKFVGIISENPYQNPPPFEKLKGVENLYSRRINIKHRLVYEIEKDTIIIKMLFSHYEK